MLREHEELVEVLLTEKYPFEHAREILTEAGIADPIKADKNIRLLAGRGAGYDIFCTILPNVIRLLRDVEYPENWWARSIFVEHPEQPPLIDGLTAPRNHQFLLQSKRIGARHRAKLTTMLTRHACFGGNIYEP